jgi:hypothetical protein
VSGRRLVAVASTGLLAAWLLGAALAYRLGSPAEIGAVLERALGEPVTVGRVGVGFVPWPSVALRDVRVVDGRGVELEVPVVRASPDLGALLRGELRVGHVTLRRPRLRWDTREDGDAPGARTSRPARPDEARGGDAPTPSGRRRREAVGVSIVDGRVVVVRQAGPSLRCRSLQATGRLTDRAARGRIEGAACELGDASLDSIAAAGWVRMGRGRPLVRAQVSGRRLTTGHVLVQEVRGPLRVGPRGLRFGRAPMRVGGGQAEVRLRLAERPGEGRLALWMNGRGRALQYLLDEQVAMVRGRWTAAVRLRGALPWQRGFRRRLLGTGRLVVLDGVVGPVSLGAALRDAVGRWGGREAGRTLREAHPDLFGRRQVRFDRFATSFAVRRGRVRTTDLDVRSTSYAAAGRGSIGFDGSLSGRVLVRASPELTANLLGAGGLRALATGGAEALEVPVRVGGWVARPNVRPDASYTRGIVDRLLGGPGAARALERSLER